MECFTFNGMFELNVKTFCPRKVNGGNQNFENYGGTLRTALYSF